ncbi:MAG: DivIVA domain-containing protein [Eubacteriales bacterium]
MAITPNDILSKTFERSFRGYDEDQVDAFLDVLKEEIERINEENHLLMGQIMSLEEEMQTYRADGSEAPQKEASAPELDDMGRAGIETAKATAARIISDAKESAETIVKAANKKAAEMMTRIEAERKREGIVVPDAEAEAEASKSVTEAKDNANEIMELARRRAGELLTRAKADANEQAKGILAQARTKAASTETEMSEKLAGAKSQLESIQSAVKAYKTKLETFINGQSQAFQGFDPKVPGFDPKSLNTPTVSAEKPVEKSVEKPVDIKPEPVVAKKAEPAVQEKPEPTVSAQTEPVASTQTEPVGPAETEQAEAKYKPYQPMPNDKGYADDLKFSGYGFGKPAETTTPKAEPAIQMESEKEEAAASPKVSNIITAESLQHSEPEKETKAKKSDDEADERYRQVLSQIRDIEKTKDELKSQQKQAPIESVNPVKDMTDKVETVEHKADGSSVIISDDDDFVGKISAADPVEWDEPVPMSDDEKRHLREMLDDML